MAECSRERCQAAWERAARWMARSCNRTFLCVLESIKTMRFTWLNVAGRLDATNETQTLRLCDVSPIRGRHESLEPALELDA